MNARSPLAAALQSAVLLLFFGMIVFPIAWMMLTAFKLQTGVENATMLHVSCFIIPLDMIFHLLTRIIGF